MEAYIQWRKIQSAIARELGICEKDATAMVSTATGERPHSDWTGTKTAYICELLHNEGGPECLCLLDRHIFNGSIGYRCLGLKYYTAQLQVREAVGSLAAGLFMIGLPFGSLLSGPFSETFGRNVVYIVTLALYPLFIMAAALAPTVASHLVFRFLAGWRAMFVSTVLVYLIVPVVYSWTCKKYEQTGRILPCRMRCWVAPPLSPWASSGWGGLAIIWSSLIASSLVGFGMTTILTSAYLYVIDSYGVFSASALGFMASTRYLVSGGVMIAGSII
ncbi:uncharacterized protein BO66DRAFT_398352 [Aspergillus aculeatinus CBS 121060]|uniref:Uncharacterized protein n=1 Tax=Aspergillus aculeatinus CBS 121060 TaxID=1448322 RepID=A0ACD1HKS3_9EURO|nr:hypothetical protein BO66DRAFT_398352 [Aspergillus aculeatinus CBS 121060]RAH73963.1 hypothetical protein BO66DRAFT_398352 [Aspergillus aculeatinus CBS 121060]